LCLVFSGAERDSPESEFRGKTSLFAKFVRRDAIKLSVALDGNRLLTIGVNGVIGSFAEQAKSIGFEVFHQITPAH
jgi:hypothetical protein